MKSKIPLLLMEQIVMLLVFALAAALCLQAFVLSDRISAESRNRDRAATLVQEAAETVRHCGSVSGAAGILDAEYADGALCLYFDESWQPGGTGYILTAEEIPGGLPGLGRARVWVEPCTGSDKALFEVTVAWQEPLPEGEEAEPDGR